MSSSAVFPRRKRPRLDTLDEDLEDFSSSQASSTASSVCSGLDESEDLQDRGHHNLSWISHILQQPQVNGRKSKKRFQMQKVPDDSSEDEPVQAAKRMRTFSCRRTTPIQSSQATHDNSEARPWHRLRKMKKAGDGSSWCSDIKHRDGHTSKDQEIRDKQKMGTIVRPSPRNKKQHLRELTITNTQNDDFLAPEASTLLYQDMKRSFSPSSSFRFQQPQVRSTVYLEEKVLHEEDSVHAPNTFDSVDVFSDKSVDIKEQAPTTVDFCNFLCEKTEQLKAEVKTLTSENKRKDALIRKLQKQNDMNTRKPLKGHVNGLEWHLVYEADGEPQVLGNGSYGKVYKAFCASIGKFLAAKVVLDLTQKSADVLKKELKQLTALEPHDRIVTYFGTCYAKHPRFNENSLFVFTEYMPGGSLSSYLDKGPLTIRQMWHYTEQILEGVQYLHKCKIIHRDIKGSNIMRDWKGNVKLADFGSAKQICSESLNKDKTRYPYGTAPWAAPEVLRGQAAKPQSDIWSIGATVVEMLTGETPYTNENFDNRLAIVYQVGSYSIDPLTSMKKGGKVDVGAEYFLMQCFKSVAEERPSATDLLKLLSMIKEYM